MSIDIHQILVPTLLVDFYEVFLLVSAEIEKILADIGHRRDSQLLVSQIPPRDFSIKIRVIWREMVMSQTCSDMASPYHYNKYKPYT